MNRIQLQQLALDKIDDSLALLNAGRWSSAYYLVGYAIECTLKSCLLRHIDRTGMIFTDEEFLKKLAKCWTHDLKDLVNLAKLDKVFGLARQANTALDDNWTIAANWEPQSRYTHKSESEARELFAAITDPTNGVLIWLQSHW